MVATTDGFPLAALSPTTASSAVKPSASRSRTGASSSSSALSMAVVSLAGPPATMLTGRVGSVPKVGALVGVEDSLQAWRAGVGGGEPCALREGCCGCGLAAVMKCLQRRRNVLVIHQYWVSGSFEA